MPYAPAERNLIPEIIGHTADEMQGAIKEYQKRQDQTAFNQGVLQTIMKQYPSYLTPEDVKSMSGDPNKASGTVAVLLQRIQQDEQAKLQEARLKNTVTVTGMQTGSQEKVAGIDTGSREKIAGVQTGSAEKIAGVETGSREKIAGEQIGAEKPLKEAQAGAITTATEKQKRAGTLSSVTMPDGNQVILGVFDDKGNIDPKPVEAARSLFLPPGRLEQVKDDQGRLVGIKVEQRDGKIDYHSVGADPTALFAALGLRPVGGATPSPTPGTSPTPGATPGTTPSPAAATSATPAASPSPTPRVAMGGYKIGVRYAGKLYLGGPIADPSSWQN